MLRSMCKSKIHRATVTAAELHYPGSLTIDADLMDAADIVPFERVQVVNINNGARFETYAITGDRGRGEICLNGAAARLGQPGDLVIIITYVMMEDAESRGHKPIVVHVDEKNRMTE